jgi:hypothetical protein
MKKWEEEIRTEYSKKYEGILPERVINDSANWLIDSISKELDSQRKEAQIEILQRQRGIMGNYNCQHQKSRTKCNFQKNYHRLLDTELDQLNKLTRKEER